MKIEMKTASNKAALQKLSDSRQVLAHRQQKNSARLQLR